MSASDAKISAGIFVNGHETYGSFKPERCAMQKWHAKFWFGSFTPDDIPCVYLALFGLLHRPNPTLISS